MAKHVGSRQRTGLQGIVAGLPHHSSWQPGAQGLLHGGVKQASQSMTAWTYLLSGVMDGAALSYI